MRTDLRYPAALLLLCLIPLRDQEAAARRHHRKRPAAATVRGDAPASPRPSIPPVSSTQIATPAPSPSATPIPELPEPDPEPLEPEPAPLTPDASPTPPTAPGGDVVEVIEGLGPPPSPAAPATTAVAPPSPDQFQASGWVRTRLTFGLLETGPVEGDRYAVPHDRLQAQGQLHLRLRYARGRRFEAVVSGLLGGSLFEQDATPPDNFNLFNGEVRTSYDAILREAYVGCFFSRFDLRVGQQRISWGRSDAFTPNDVVNAYDLRDQLFTETDMNRLPTFALRGDLSVGPLVISAVLSPFYQPSRFESYGGNWALIQPDAPAVYRVLASQTRSALAIDSTLYPALQPLLQQTALPPADVRGAAAGLRLGLTLPGVDLDAYYHYGYDPAPSLQIAPSVTQTLALLNLDTVDSTTISSLLLSSVGQGTISATYQRRHHVGLSAAAPVGPFVLRGDFAFDSQAVFQGSDLQGVVRPTVQAVAGIEYQRGDLGKIVALEAQYQYIDDLPSEESLLFNRTHNVALAALVRWTFLRDRLQLELRALTGLHPLSYVVRPQVAYRYRGLELRLGAVLLGGEDRTFASYYQRNLSIFTIARYSF